MKFLTIVLALSGVASAQFPWGGGNWGGGNGNGNGMGGGRGGMGGGWDFAPSCAVSIFVLHLH